MTAKKEVGERVGKDWKTVFRESKELSYYGEGR